MPLPEKMIFDTSYYYVDENDLQQYEYYVSLAKEAGFTHMDLSQLHDRARWCVADDPTDPWLQWNLHNASLFKLLPPDGMKKFAPADWVGHDLALVIAKGRILEKYGMKGVFCTWDPTWVPECMFDEHPDWRGPRVDHPRRTKNKRFALCMDHPEVLKLYRDTVKRLLELVPCIDTFNVRTNDSGAGMCWSSHLYNNPNGPAACRNIGMGDRVATFLDNLRQGCLDAGVDAQVTLASQLSHDETESILASLKPGCGLLDWNQTIDPRREFFRRAGNSYFSPFPTRALPMHSLLADNLRKAHGAPRVQIYLHPMEPTYFADYMKIIKRALSSENYNYADRFALLYELAKEQTGDAGASDLVEAWDLISQAMLIIREPNSGGTIFDCCILQQRWLNRPFVPFPGELTEDEKGYYINNIFQADEDDKDDMMNFQAAKIIDSITGARHLRNAWRHAIDRLNKARDIFGNLADNETDGQMKATFRRTYFSIRAVLCIARCALNCCSFQTYMYKFAPPEGGVQKDCMPDAGDYNRADVYEIYRDEIDNMYELIGIMNECPDIMITGQREEQEDVFTFSPNLSEQLRKKIRIMMDHWQDFDRIFPRPNR